MKQFILKVDDFRLNEGASKFTRLFELCDAHEIPASVGVIGGGLRGDRFDHQERFSRRCEQGLVELWNHSFNHRDLTQLDDDEVAWELAATTSLCERCLGHRPIGFGAPFNKSNDRVAKLAAGQGFAFTYEESFVKAQLVTPEYNIPFDGQPNLAQFKERIAARSKLDTLIIQVHPGRWLSRGFDEMHACLGFLKESGYRPVTARQALGLSGAKHGAPRAKGVHELMWNRLGEFWSSRAADYDRDLSNFSSYFLGRFKANSSSINALLRRLDLDREARQIVDVGCGLSQWGLPFFEFARDATLWAMDTNEVLARALRDAQTAKLIPYNLHVSQEDFTTTTALPQRKVDRIVCANALNYIPTVAFVRQSRAVCKDDSHVLLLNQTAAFNEVGVRSALDAHNVSMAKERALAELRQQATRLGFRGFLPSRTTPTVHELEALFYSFGFQLTDDFVPSWEQSFEGRPTFQGLVFTRRSWARAAEIPTTSQVAFRTLLCQGGWSAYDDELFPASQESVPLGLALLKARSGERSPSDPALHGDAELGRLVADRKFQQACEYVANAREPHAEWHFAGVVAALIAADAKAALEHARRAEETLPASTRKLIRATCLLVEGQTMEARAVLS